MEEILASIRRIISEDDKNDAESKEMQFKDFTIENEDVLELTEVIEDEEILVEDLTKEIMRPMIKDWLDNNLPALVERAVSLEIKRLSKLGKSND